MASATEVLIQSKVSEAGETTQYTSTNCTTIIDKFTAYNPTAGLLPLTVSLVESGGAGGGASRTVLVNVQAGRTYTFPELVGHTLMNGDFISTLGAGLNIRSSGRKIS